jgi:hypothetical protein
MRLSISWIISMLICVVVAFNFLALVVSQINNLCNFQRSRKRMRSMKDRVVRLKPLIMPLPLVKEPPTIIRMKPLIKPMTIVFEKLQDASINQIDESKDENLLKERKFQSHFSDNYQS